MDVIDNDIAVHLNWFKLIDSPSQALRVAYEEFYHDHFLDGGVSVGYIKPVENGMPQYLLGTNELKVISAIRKEFGEAVELVQDQNEIKMICIG